jgi:hypothetical protein
MTLRVANWEPKIAKQREHAEKGTPTPPKERKPLTLFHFNQKGVGEISVQPVVGQINGAQMQMSF